jgi:hypothetical protein
MEEIRLLIQFLPKHILMENWATNYYNGEIREFGKFATYSGFLGFHSKRNLTQVKVGIWNYYNEKCNLERIQDYGKKGWLSLD